MANPGFSNRLIGAAVSRISIEENNKQIRNMVRDAVDQAIRASEFKDKASHTLNELVAVKVHDCSTQIEAQVTNYIVESGRDQDRIRRAFEKEVINQSRTIINDAVRNTVQSIQEGVRQQLADALRNQVVRIDLGALISEGPDSDDWD